MSEKNEKLSQWLAPETAQRDVKELGADGYESLINVLRRAFAQAAFGKGKKRHANDDPFDEQIIIEGANRFGTGALLFQAFKKSEESQRLPHDRAVAELLGAIVYLAGAVVSLEKKNAPANENCEKAQAANDSRIFMHCVYWEPICNARTEIPKLSIRSKIELLHKDGIKTSRSSPSAFDWDSILSADSLVIGYRVVES